MSSYLENKFENGCHSIRKVCGGYTIGKLLITVEFSVTKRTTTVRFGVGFSLVERLFGNVYQVNGKWVEMQPNCACHCVLHLIHCIYYLFVMFLALFCLHSQHQHHMWTCLTGLGNGRGWQLFIWYTHNVGVLWSCGSVWVHADACGCVWVYVDVWECL